MIEKLDIRLMYLSNSRILSQSTQRQILFVLKIDIRPSDFTI